MIAADIMTRDVQTIRTNASIAHAIDLMQSLDVRHLPVVNEAEELVGILSDRDLRSLLASEGEDSDEEGAGLRTRQAVSSVMSENVAALNAHVDLDGILDRLVDEKVGALPVVNEENQVVGIVSYIDVLQVWRRWRMDGAVAEIPEEPSEEEAPAPRKAPAKKAAPKKAAPKKAAPKKAAPKKAAPKKAAPKKAAPKKAAAKKAPAKKGTATKAAPKAAGRKNR